MGKKIVGIGVLVITLVAGFIFLLRGCLSAYDERAALPPVLYFEKNGQAVVLAIVKYESATSYKSNGGSVSKTVSTNYYIQTNDAVTGAKVYSKKIRHHSDVKNFPITVLGKSNGNAWVFIGEPMLFNPFTLEKIADKAIIESKNAALKGKMPDQQTYYKYNAVTSGLLITATDGIKYSLSGSTLLATALDEEEDAKNPLSAAIKMQEKQLKYYDKLNENYYKQFRDFNKLYSDKKIDYKTYLDSTRYFNKENDAIRKIRDSIQENIRDISESARMDESRLRNADQLKGNTNISLGTLSVEADTINGKWYGLTTAKSLEKFYNRFDYRNNYEETARNKLYSASTSIKDPAKKAVEILVDEPKKISDASFLQGGFLLNKETALPIHVKNEDGFIVAYKEKVGYNGFIILARIDLQGNIRWTVNTNTAQLADWIYTGNSLIILSKDNKALSSGDANVLSIIDIQTGKATVYDYFKDKMRGNKAE